MQTGLRSARSCRCSRRGPPSCPCRDGCCLRHPGAVAGAAHGAQGRALFEGCPGGMPTFTNLGTSGTCTTLAAKMARTPVTPVEAAIVVYDSERCRRLGFVAWRGTARGAGRRANRPGGACQNLIQPFLTSPIPDGSARGRALPPEPYRRTARRRAAVRGCRLNDGVNDCRARRPAPRLLHHFSEWPQVFGGDEKLTTALIDRLADRATIITTRGRSFRLRRRRGREPAATSPAGPAQQEMPEA
jgi:hypothetical protein